MSVSVQLIVLENFPAPPPMLEMLTQSIVHIFENNIGLGEGENFSTLENRSLKNSSESKNSLLKEELKCWSGVNARFK